MENKNWHILLVDDDDISVTFLLEFLGKFFQHVTVCSSGQAALKVFREQPVDLLLLDENMPGLAGVDVLREVRNDHNLLHLPVIMITAENDPNRVAEFFTAGANDYILKPVNLQVLLARIKTQFSALKLVTELSEMLIELEETRKIEAIATLAGGVAHDFNNIFFSLLGHAKLMRHNVNNPQVVEKQMAQIGTLVGRGCGLADKLLDYSKQGSFTVSKLNLKELVLQAVSIIEEQFGCRPHVRGIDNCWIEGDKRQVFRMLHALLSNAVEASSAAADAIEISIQCPGHPTPPQLSGNGVVQLEIHDSGQGIAAENMPKIFDPYFSTKEIGKGSGLGLSMVQGVVQSLGGRIKLDTLAKQGTTVIITLPAAFHPQSVNASVPANPPIRKKITSGALDNRRLLIVDDDDSILDMMVEIIAVDEPHLSVEVAKNGKEALKIIEKQPIPFDFILSDIRMPIMDGITLTRKLHKMGFLGNIVLATAYAENSQLLAVQKDLNISFIRKPYELNELFVILHEHLQQNNTPSTPVIKLGFNKKMIMARFDGNAAIIATVAEKFLQQSSNILQALETAKKQNDLSQVSRLTHKLKGAASYFLDTEQLQVIAQLEASADRREGAQVTVLLAKSKKLLRN